MSVFPEKRQGSLTGRFIVSVMRDGRRMKDVAPDPKSAHTLEQIMKLGLWKPKHVPEELPVGQNPSESFTLKTLWSAGSVVFAGAKDEIQSGARLKDACGIIGLSRLASSLTTTDLDKLSSILLARPGRAKGTRTSNGTVNRHLSALSAAMKWAKKRPEATGVTSVPEFPWLREKAPERVTISREDQDRLLEWLKRHNEYECAVTLQVLLSAGMRVSELLRLTPEDMEGNIAILKDTKTGDTRRVPIAPQSLRDDLWELLTERRLPYYRKLSKALQRAVKTLGLDQRLTIHCMRHTMATRVANSGHSDVTGMRLLGHKQHSTYAKYVHTNDDALVAAVTGAASAGAIAPRQ